jgi:muramidase (phage lysozyme)
MNGRVYDPDLGRFLSADPNVQEPLNSQNLNRYSYVLNNPLSYTDPSGYFFGKLFDAIGDVFDFVFDNIRTIAAIAVAAVIMYYCPGCAPLAGFVSGMIGSGGDLRAGIIGAFTATAFQGIGEAFGPNLSFASNAGKALLKTVAHGVVGGLSSVAQGGDFLSGFVSAGATQAFSLSGGFEALGGADPGSANFGGFDYVHNMTVAAVVGGTAAVLGGGKFKNGALTGAFSRLFNDLKLHGDFAQRQQQRRLLAEILLKNARIRAYLNIISIAEGADYDSLFGGGKFSSFASHPGIAVTAGSYTSTAAGAYQFVKGTWELEARLMDLSDFSPLSQDLAAVDLLIRSGASHQLLYSSGLYNGVYRATELVSPTWASLPGGAQPRVSITEVMQRFHSLTGE